MLTETSAIPSAPPFSAAASPGPLDVPSPLDPAVVLPLPPLGAGEPPVPLAVLPPFAVDIPLPLLSGRLPAPPLLPPAPAAPLLPADGGEQAIPAKPIAHRSATRLVVPNMQGMYSHANGLTTAMSWWGRRTLTWTT